MIVVMAKTPLPGKPHATTAFIVETSWPGVEIIHRCRFMGLKALYNGVIRFENVRVPAANVLGGVGRGLKVALDDAEHGPHHASGRLHRPVTALPGHQHPLGEVA
jgi:alkylation response protein AidB-like acyl-CoA dehydrogenase